MEWLGLVAQPRTDGVSRALHISIFLSRDWTFTPIYLVDNSTTTWSTTAGTNRLLLLEDMSPGCCLRLEYIDYVRMGSSPMRRVDMFTVENWIVALDEQGWANSLEIHCTSILVFLMFEERKRRGIERRKYEARPIFIFVLLFKIIADVTAFLYVVLLSVVFWRLRVINVMFATFR